MAARGVRLADQGNFWIGVEYDRRDGQSVVDGTQLYVEFQIPEELAQPYPAVLIHGGGGQGLDWMSTPDGRPGWRTLLLQRGYAVFVVDRPGHGRSPRAVAEGGTEPVLAFGRLPSAESVGQVFAGRDDAAHTQWPGSGRIDDPALAQVLAGLRQTPYDLVEHHALMRRRGAQLLDRTGPAVLMTSSAGGPVGWLMADERPELVRAIVSLEPVGPTWPVALPWGITASPVTYDPPVSRSGELALVEALGDDGGPLRLQPTPPRRLPHLVDLPIAIVTAERSFAAPLDRGTVAFLRQAGCRRLEHLQLVELGITGNGHLAMMERNNDRILDVVLRWLEEAVRGDAVEGC